jgi:hypothetical protein
VRPRSAPQPRAPRTRSSWTRSRRAAGRPSPARAGCPSCSACGSFEARPARGVDSAPPDLIENFASFHGRPRSSPRARSGRRRTGRRLAFGLDGGVLGSALIAPSTAICAGTTRAPRPWSRCSSEECWCPRSPRVRTATAPAEIWLQDCMNAARWDGPGLGIFMTGAALPLVVPPWSAGDGRTFRGERVRVGDMTDVSW